MVCYVTQEMCESELGKKIQLFRAERPDEWTMDEFIRDAEQQAQTIKELQAELQAKTEECDGLRAQVSRIYGAIQSIKESSVDDKTWYLLNAVIDETPTQSLSAIRNEVREECAAMADNCYFGPDASIAIRNLKTCPQLTEEE